MAKEGGKAMVRLPSGELLSVWTARLPSALLVTLIILTYSWVRLAVPSSGYPPDRSWFCNEPGDHRTAAKAFDRSSVSGYPVGQAGYGLQDRKKNHRTDKQIARRRNGK